jgi:hypothetical protein
MSSGSFRSIAAIAVSRSPSIRRAPRSIKPHVLTGNPSGPANSAWPWAACRLSLAVGGLPPQMGE